MSDRFFTAAIAAVCALEFAFFMSLTQLAGGGAAFV